MRKCYKTGKQMFLTRAPAEKAMARLNKVRHSEAGSVYLCQYCHQYHITHWGYEAQEYMDRIMKLRRRKNKKQMRSERHNQLKHPWKDPIPLREQIKAFQRQNRNNMTQEEFDKFLNSEEMRMAYLKLNAASLLADVIDSFLTDAYADLAKGKNYFKQEYKRKWNNMTEAVRMAKAQAKQCSHLVYKCDDVDAACNESDLLADLILTILQRTNDASNEHMEQSYKLMKATIIKNFKNLFIEHKKEPIK